MRLAATLILILMAAGALAEEPRPVIYYGHEQGISQPRLHGDTAEGIDWFQGTQPEQGTTQHAAEKWIPLEAALRHWGDPHENLNGKQ